MPIELPKVNDFIDVPLRVDSALNMTREEYDAYLETLDASVLKFKDGEIPTYFRLRKVLPYRLSQKVEDMKMRMEYGAKGEEARVSPRMAWITEEVRCSLIAVINPPGLPADQCIEFKQDGESGALPEFMSQIVALGVVMDLYNARHAVKRSTPDKKK